jgi:hypothetical protein
VRSSLAISSVTWQEVLYGMLLLPAGKRRDQIEDYLFRRVRTSLPIIGFEGEPRGGRRSNVPTCAKSADPLLAWIHRLQRSLP